jgi:two-component system, LytTR family, response regulator
MTQLRVFIVDDEQPARRKLRRFLKDDGGTIVVGEAGKGPEAVRGIEESRPDLVFLDVQMKGMDGFDVIRALDPETLPRIVFVTAHDQYAMQAFDVHAFGYLLKPFDRPRFEKVLGDAKKEFARHRERDNRSGDLARLLAEIERRRAAPRRILVEQNDRAVFIPVDRIDWVESQRNYVTLHCGGSDHTLRGTLDSLEQKLDSSEFMRANRSTLVRIDFIRELRKWFHGEYKVVLKSGVTLTWTRRYVGSHPELLQKI